MSLHAVDWFTIGGSFASASSIFVAIGIYSFQRKQEEKNKKEIKRLKVNAMNRLLAHKAQYVCRSVMFLSEVCFQVLEFNVTKIKYFGDRNMVLFEKNDGNHNASSKKYLSIPEKYESLNENTLLVCAELSDRKNELLPIAIKMVAGGDSFEGFISILVDCAKTNNAANIKEIFGKNKKGQYVIIDHLHEIILYLGKLGPEIEHYKIYQRARNLLNKLKKKYISDKV